MKFDLKIVIKGMFIALCIFIASLLAVRFIDRIFFRPESVFARTVKGFEEKKDEIQILFLGPCLTKYAVIPKAMPYKSYNFAEFGENYIGNYFKLKHYIDEMPRLKIVVLTLPLDSFSSPHLDWIENQWFSNYSSFITYQDLRELYKILGFTVVEQILTSFSPMLERRQMKIFLKNVKKWIQNKPIRVSEINDGYFYSTSVSVVTEEHAIEMVDRIFRKKNYFDKDLLSYFEKILILCHDREVKVVTLTIPMTDYYIKHAEKYMTKAALFEKVLTDPKFSPYIYKHLDYLTLYTKDHALFIDPGHLNHKGATVFSERIASELLKVLEQIKKAH